MSYALVFAEEGSISEEDVLRLETDGNMVIFVPAGAPRPFGVVLDYENYSDEN